MRSNSIFQQERDLKELEKMREKGNFQRCVKRIVVEENKWRHKGGSDKQVSVYFEPRVFRYCPRYNELRAIIDALIEVDGKEKVEEELNILSNKREVEGTFECLS